MDAKVIWDLDSNKFVNNGTLYIYEVERNEEISVTEDTSKFLSRIKNVWQEMLAIKKANSKFNEQSEDIAVRKLKVDEEMLKWRGKNAEFILMADTGMWGSDKWALEQSVIVYFKIKSNFNIGFIVDKFVMEHMIMPDPDYVLDKFEDNKDYVTNDEYEEIVSPGNDDTPEKEYENEDVLKNPSSFIWPLKNKIVVTSRFGKRTLNGKTRQHKGVDLRCNKLSCMSSYDGTVINAGYIGAYGLVVYIKHENGWETRYAHLDKIYVKVGQKVKQGELIGVTGKTGGNYYPHLHFEIRDSKSNCFDPTKIITQDFEYKVGV